MQEPLRIAEYLNHLPIGRGGEHALDQPHMMGILSKGKHEPGAADQNILPSESTQRIRSAIGEIQFPFNF